MKVTDLTAQLAQPLVEAAGCTLWDVEYIREGGTWYLRVFIDAPEGVNIDQCEAVSRPLSDALDEADPIQGSYVLEVGSAGADRALKKPEHFALTTVLFTVIGMEYFQSGSVDSRASSAVRSSSNGILESTIILTS